MKKDPIVQAIEGLEKRLDNKFFGALDELEKKLTGAFAKLETSVQNMAYVLAEHTERFDQLDEKLTHFITRKEFHETMDGFMVRMTKHDDEIASLGHRFLRLEEKVLT